MSRTPFRVTVRRMATGCDYTKTFWLKSEADAFDVAARNVRLVHGIARDGLRFVSCTSDPDAKRPGQEG